MPSFDRISQRWLARSRSPYVDEIAAIAGALDFSGVWLLNASMQWGCTSRASAHDGVPWLLRTLDWPFLIVATWTALAFLWRGRVGRGEGAALLGLYGVYLGLHIVLR